MRHITLIALGAGLVSAVVFISATSGPVFSRFLLMMITPLPLFLAGLGWGWMTAALGAVAGTLLIAVATTPAIGALFGLTQGAPAALLTYFALLNRDVPAHHGGASHTEWYPVGRIVLWAAAISGAIGIAAALIAGGDLDSLKKTLRDFVENFVKHELPQISGAPTLTPGDIGQLSDILFRVFPAASAMSMMAGLVVNLWLAGRITKASGRLQRPWPDIAAMAYPAGTPLVLAGATAGSFLDDYAGFSFAGFAGSFFIAYMLIGLAIVHYTTRGLSWRPMAIAATYLSLIVVNPWAGLAFALMGLAESFVTIRRNLPPQR